MPKTQRA